MASVKEAIKETIRELISEAFDDYVSEEKLEEAGWEFLKSELGLVGWDSMRGLYYTRSKAIDKAQAALWEKVEELADEYNLDVDRLWEDYVIEPMMMDESYDEDVLKVLKEKGLEDVVEYVGIGYDGMEGGFFVVINPKVVRGLLGADVDEVAEEFVKGISEKDLEKLEREYWKKVEEYKEEGWEVDEKEILEKVAEDYLLEREEELAWLYVEKSEDMKKFIEAVEEVEKYLASCLLSASEDYIEELVRDGIGAEDGQKLNREQALEFLKGELRKMLTDLDVDYAAHIARIVVRKDLERHGFKEVSFAGGSFIKLNKATGFVEKHYKKLDEDSLNQLIGQLEKKLSDGWQKVLKEYGLEELSEHLPVVYKDGIGFGIMMFDGAFQDLEFSGDREKVIEELLEEEEVKEWLGKRDYRTEAEILRLVEKVDWDLMYDYVESCEDVQALAKTLREAMLKVKLVEEAVVKEAELEVSRLLEAGSEPRV